MTDSKAPRLAWGAALALMVAAGLTLAACTGSDDGLSLSEEEALQERVERAEEAKRQAELKAAREEERRLAEERARQAAEQAQRDAEAGEEAADDRADAAEQKLDRFVAYEIVSAIPPSTSRTSVTSTVPAVPTAGSPAVDALFYNEPVLATAPGATFTSTSTGSSAGWFTTTRSGSSEQRKDFVEIFSNVEAPFREDFRDHPLGTPLTYDTNGRVLGGACRNPALSGILPPSEADCPRNRDRSLILSGLPQPGRGERPHVAGTDTIWFLALHSRRSVSVA